MGTLARPGDTDLDVDIDGISVTAVVVLDGSLLVRFSGGWGTVGGDNMPSLDSFPGDNTSENEIAAEAVVQWDETSSSVMAGYVQLLEKWRDTSTPLHLVGAPGKMFLLLEDEQSWLPLPR